MNNIATTKKTKMLNTWKLQKIIHKKYESHVFMRDKNNVFYVALLVV